MKNILEIAQVCNDLNRINKLIISNELVEATYDLTLQELKILFFILAHHRREKITVSKKALASIVKKHYEVINKILIKLSTPIISIASKKLHIIERVIEHHDRYEIELNNEILKHKSKNYTTLSLDTLLAFKHKYSIRLYIMLSRYIDTKQRYDRIEDLKRKLCINKYSEWKDFKKRVLKPALKEIASLLQIKYKINDDRIHFIIEKSSNISIEKAKEEKPKEEKAKEKAKEEKIIEKSSEYTKEKAREEKAREYIDKFFTQEFINYLQEQKTIMNPFAVMKKMKQDEIELNIRHVIKRTIEDIPDAKETITDLANRNIYAAFLYVRRPDQRERILSALSVLERGTNDIR